MKRTSPSSAAAVVMATASATASTAKTSATAAMKTIKMQQFVGLMAIIVAVNCMRINVISAATLQAEEQEVANKVKAIQKKCIASAGLSAEQRQLIYDHKLFTPSTTLANTPKAIQCYCLCYLNESEIFANDKPNDKFLRTILPIMINDKKKATAVLDKCSKLHGKDKCEIGFNFELCLILETGLYIY